MIPHEQPLAWDWGVPGCEQANQALSKHLLSMAIISEYGLCTGEWNEQLEEWMGTEMNNWRRSSDFVFALSEHTAGLGRAVPAHNLSQTLQARVSAGLAGFKETLQP